MKMNNREWTFLLIGWFIGTIVGFVLANRNRK